MELTAHAPGLVGARLDARGHRWGRVAGADACTTTPLEALWDRHGGSVYALACALLGDEAAAVRVVTQAMVDLARSPGSESSEDALRSLARHVYWRSQEAPVAPTGTPHLPPVMVWLGQLAQLQRASLALCFYGGLTHREAADLLGVPPSTVAELLTTGLRELGHVAAGEIATSA